MGIALGTALGVLCAEETPTQRPRGYHRNGARKHGFIARLVFSGRMV